MYLLKYHGEEISVQVFTSAEKAINYCISEIKDHVGEFNPTTQIINREVNNSGYEWLSDVLNDESIQSIILDQDGGDFRIYTVEKITKIDPEYVSRY